MRGALYLGVDVGTTAIKAAVFSADGVVEVLETVDSPVKRTHPGWSEQSMDEVWQLTAGAILQAVQQVDVARIVSLGVCAQGDGLWMLDQQQRPLRNAVLWNDQRAEAQILDWIDDGTSEQLSRLCRTANWPGTAGSIFRWLKDNEPETIRNLGTVFFCKDWINFNLTGQIATDFSDATIPFLDLETRSYSHDASQLLGVAEVENKLATPLAANSVHGRILPEIAEELGLPIDLPVAVGTIDLAAMMVGMGLQKSGDICLILGTAAVVNVIVDPEPFGVQPAGATLAHPLSQRWIRVLAPSSGASALDWFSSLHPKTLEGNSPKEIAQKLNALAGNVPIGSNNVMFLPFLAGERAPFVAPHAKASFNGLSSSTTPAEMARAVLEGVAFSMKHCFESTGLASPSQVFLTGGGARNPLWCDIVANVFDAEIVASDASDHGLWGAALIGADAADQIDLQNTPRRTEETRTHRPDREAAQTYRNLFETYKASLTVSMELWDLKRRIDRKWQ